MCAGIVGAMCMSGCERPREVQVKFSARDVEGARVACGQRVALHDGASLSLKKLRFYLSEVAFRHRDGAWIMPGQPPGLDHAGEGVWLVDLDDALCDATYSPHVHDTLTMQLPGGDYDAIRFTLGVPERLNHNDPLKAPEHLALTSMHWGWQGGYRFFRLDGELDGGTSYAVHLGSTACEGEIGEAISCARENRAVFTLESANLLDRNMAHVKLDLGALLEGVAWREASGCMGNVEEGDCATILENMGLDPELGTPSPGRASRVFTLDDPR